MFPLLLIVEEALVTEKVFNVPVAVVPDKLVIRILTRPGDAIVPLTPMEVLVVFVLTVC